MPEREMNRERGMRVSGYVQIHNVGGKKLAFQRKRGVP